MSETELKPLETMRDADGPAYRHWFRSSPGTMVGVVSPFKEPGDAPGGWGGSVYERTTVLVPARESDRQLMDFYSVESLHELIDAQERHVAKLQAKLPPLRDEFKRTPRA